MVSFSSRRRNARNIVVGVTAAGSAGLMKGQLGWFQKRGWNVELVSGPEDQVKVAAENEGVSYTSIQMDRGISVARDFRSLMEWISFLWRRRPSVINVGTPKAGLLGGIAGWLTRVPRRIYVVRGLRLEGSSGFVACVLWIMERLSTAVATDVVIVSESLGNELNKRRLVNAKKTWLIGDGSSNGVEAATIRQRIGRVNQVNLRKQVGLGEHSFVVGYIGRLTKDKGIHTFLKAIELLNDSPNVEFLLIGKPDGGFDPLELKPYADRIKWVNGTQDVPSYLAIMDMLALPTYREGFPNVVLEASAAGIPTVTTLATGARDSVIHGETGYVIDVADSGQLAEKVRVLSSDSGLTKKMGELAQARVIQDFRPERIWTGLESVFMGQPSQDVKRLDNILDNLVPNNGGNE